MRSIVLILFFLTKIVAGQEIIILDSITNLPIKGTSINNHALSNIVFSNEFGLADITNFDHNDTLFFNHLAYKKTNMIKKNIINKEVRLSLKTHALENIDISDSKTTSLKELNFIKTKRPSIINSQSSQISGLLEKNMGLSIQHSQSGGGSPNLKGMEANKLLIVVDGVPLNNTIFRSGHMQASSTINPIFLENIEILSGPASVVYGNAAMNGAIVMNTKKPNQDCSTEIIQQYETSSKAIFTSLMSNYKLKNSTHVLGISLKSYQDLKMGANRIHGFKNWGNENIIVKNNVQEKTGYTQGDFLLKSLLKLNRSVFLILNTHMSSSSNINRFDKLNDVNNGAAKYKHWYYGPQKRLFQSLRLKNYSSSYIYDESTYTLAFQKIQESRHKQKTSDLYLNNRKEDLSILDFMCSYFKKINTTHLDWGLDFRYQKLNSTANLSNKNEYYYNTTRYPDGGTSVINNGFYTHGKFKFSKKIIALTGLRFNINSLSACFKDTTTVKLPFKEIRLENTSFSGSFKLIYYPVSNMLLDIALSNGFRNPNTDDVGKIFSKNDVSVIIPNNKLTPEKSINIESNFKLNIENKLSINAQVFRTYITDAITRNEAQLNGLDSIWYDGELMKVLMNSNINSAIINGFCLGYNFKLSNRITLKSILNIIKGQTGSNTPLAHIPPTNLNSDLIYRHKNHRIYLNIHYNALKKSSEYDIAGIDNLEEATPIGNPSWYTLNSKYRINFDKNFVIVFGINNIMNIHYKTFGSGISSSGRNFTLSLHTYF